MDTPKCGYCEFMGIKPHCSNCRLVNGQNNNSQREITCSDEEFFAYIDDNQDITEKFSVGGYKTIELYTGDKVKVYIADFDKDILADNSGVAKITFALFFPDGKFNMNEDDTNIGGWKDSLMRKRMDKFFRLLPPIWQQHIKPVVKKTSEGGRSSTIVDTVDKLFLFAESEVFEERSYSYCGEGSQYEFFEKKSNRTTSHWWWLRSPYYGNTSNFCGVDDYGYTYYNSAGYTYGVVFGFCI